MSTPTLPHPPDNLNALGAASVTPIGAQRQGATLAPDCAGAACSPECLVHGCPWEALLSPPAPLLAAGA